MSNQHTFTIKDETVNDMLDKLYVFRDVLEAQVKEDNGGVDLPPVIVNGVLVALANAIFHRSFCCQGHVRTGYMVAEKLTYDLISNPQPGPAIEDLVTRWLETANKQTDGDDGKAV